MLIACLVSRRRMAEAAVLNLYTHKTFYFFK